MLGNWPLDPNQIKEFFPGSDYLYPVGMGKSSLAASAVSGEKWFLIDRRLAFYVKLTEFCNHADGLSSA